jgi:hypothetical protein
MRTLPRSPRSGPADAGGGRGGGRERQPGGAGGRCPAARDLAITLGEGASYDLRLLNAGGAYGRIAVTVRLAKGRSSTWARRSLAAATRRWKSSPK